MISLSSLGSSGNANTQSQSRSHGSSVGQSMFLTNRQVFILRGEISMMIHSLKRSTQQRWSSHQQEQKNDFPLVKQLQALKDALDSDLKATLVKISQDANYFLVPFLDIIRSEDTSGPITVLALSSVEKFLLNDIVNEANGGTSAVETITDTVIHAHFVSTDYSSDEIVLMKILQVLHRLFLSPVGYLLSNESVCELMQSCFRMCFIERANDLLRKSAETSLNDIVRVLFSRLREFPINVGKKVLADADQPIELVKEVTEHSNQGTQPEATSHEKDTVSDVAKEISSCTVENDVCDGSAFSKDSNPTTPKEIPTINIEEATPKQEHPKSSNPNIVEFKNRRGIKFTTATSDTEASVDKLTDSEIVPESDPPVEKVPVKVNSPYGIPCVRELVRFLVSLINPYEKQNTETMIHLGLKLLLVASESDMDSIAKHPALNLIFKNELVKNLIALLSYPSPGNNGTVILLNVLRILFLIFEKMRKQMKYQLEVFLTKMMEMIGDGQQQQLPSNQQPQQKSWTFEQKEVAIEYLVQLWKLPTFVTEMYLNYDCDLFCSNIFEDVTKLMSKNAFPMQTGINSIHLLCLDGLSSILDGIESHCTTRLNAAANTTTGSSDDSNSSVFYHDYEPQDLKLEKSSEAENLPTHEQLMAIRHKKKLFHTGSEQFNQNASKGITFLQTNGILSDPLDPAEVAQFLKDNPLLDKKAIGDYISSKKRSDILREFVASFDFKGTRIDEALRLFLETFRLPGEAALISRILENFSEVWTSANDNPFANVDAAYTLSYAVIMLNVDQHNSNVKQQSMTCEQFKKNLKGVNGGQEFDPEMLNKIYHAIKSEEIVMPAEHTGAVKENYLWKMLLRRAATCKSKYMYPKTDEGLYDHDLFSLSWGPIVAALSFVFDKTSDNTVITKSITGFRKCATISAHYGMSDVFDNLIISLCKFTTLLSGNPEIGTNYKAQSACHTVFQLVHRHGGILREGWKNFIDCLVALFKYRCLPKILTEAEDFTEPSGRISLVRSTQTITPRAETGLFSSLYSYIALSSSDNSPSSKSNMDDEEARKRTAALIRECHPELLLSESKFLPLDSLNDLVKNLIYTSPVPDSSRRKEYEEDAVAFAMEVLIKICIQNRDRVMVFWDPIREHVFSMIVASAGCEMNYLLERAIVGLLRLALRLMRKEDICGIVLQSLKILLYLKPASVLQLSQQISFGLHEILKTTAANIHTTDDWTIIFELLEYVGAGKVPPGPVPSTTELSSDMKGSESDSAIQKSTNESNNPTQLQHSQSQDPIHQVPSLEYSSGSDRGYTSDSELEMRPSQNSHDNKFSGVSPAQSWILLAHNTPEELQTPASPSKIAKSLLQERYQSNFMPDSKALIKSCETLSFLVRDAAHITPDNFTLCVNAIKSFVDICTLRVQPLNKAKESGTKKTKRTRKHLNEQSLPRSKSFPSQGSAYDADYESDSEADQSAASNHVSIQLLDLLHTLHTRASQIFQWWQKENMFSSAESIWTLGWKPLLQTIATLCSDGRKQIRTSAIAYLQRALLVHDLQQLTPDEWGSCFHDVLFPLMTKLLEPLNPQDLSGMEETRMRAATLLCKVFLQHLTPLMALDGFNDLWMEILTFMEKYLNCDQKSELLIEAIPESLKNLLLVMDTAGVFHTPEGYTKLWATTWEKIDSFLPNLRAEMFTVVHPMKPGIVAQAQADSAGTTNEAREVQGQPVSLRNVELPQGSLPVIVPSSDDPPPAISQNVTLSTDASSRTVTPCLNASTPSIPISPANFQMSQPRVDSPTSSSPPIYKNSPEYTSICFGDDDFEMNHNDKELDNRSSASHPPSETNFISSPAVQK